MKHIVTVTLAIGLFAPALAGAQVCPDGAPPAINVPADSGAQKCMSTIAKSSTKFVATKLKTMAKCLSARQEDLCPTAKDLAKIEKTALKSADKIAKTCDAATLANLTTSYSSGFAPADVGSCLLSQDNVEASLILMKLNGFAPGYPPSMNLSGKTCANTLNKETGKFFPKILKTINKCVDKQAKGGATGDVSLACAPSYINGDGTYLAPTDAKTADKLQKTINKFSATVEKGCPAGPTLFFASKLYACPNAATTDDLKGCGVCPGDDGAWEEINSILRNQYAETGQFVAAGAGAIQAAHDAASVGDKLLIQGGSTYEEQVTITKNGLHFVGCGGATNERPVLEPPSGGPTNRGMFASGIDDLLFQSLSPNDWDEDGIFVTGTSEVLFSNNVTFRDIVADGNINSRYIIFPAFMDGVRVELNEAFNCDDAALYVGKSRNILVRYNETYANVAGIEVENSDNADTYGNYTHGNTAGMLIFLDSTLLPRTNDNNRTFNNIVVDNNIPNFAPSGFVQNLIRGSGVYLISPTNNVFSGNYVAGNETIGLVLLDQEGVNVFAGDPWPSPPGVPGDVCTDNLIVDNTGLPSNGTNPDAALGIPVRNGAAFAEETRSPPTAAMNSGNCYDSNDQDPAFLLHNPGNDCP